MSTSLRRVFWPGSLALLAIAFHLGPAASWARESEPLPQRQGGLSRSTSPVLAQAAPTSPQATGAAFDIDESSARPLVMISTTGGVVSRLQELTSLPTFVLYGDGTAYWTRYDAHQDVRVLWQARLTRAEMLKELAWIFDRGYRGLYERYDDAQFPNLPTTTFTVNLRGESLVRSVYGMALNRQRGVLPSAIAEIFDHYNQFSHASEQPARIERIFVYARKLEKLEARQGFKRFNWGVTQVKLADFARESQTEYGQTELSGKNAERVIDRIKKWTLFSTDLSVVFFTDKKVDYQVAYRPALPHE